MTKPATEVQGLEARLDKLVYRFDPDSAPTGKPHVFIYFITIENRSLSTIRLLGRRWILNCAGGRTQVVEGDGIVGEKPRLRPGESYTFNSFHLTATQAVASGSFHGLDNEGRHILVRIPAFQLLIPSLNG